MRHNRPYPCPTVDMFMGKSQYYIRACCMHTNQLLGLLALMTLAVKTLALGYKNITSLGGKGAQGDVTG